jgi:hypothetical protein
MTRNHLLSNLALGLSLAGGLVAATPAASAQANQMQVTIPFAFTADNVPLPAGTYTVSKHENRFLYLSNVKTGETKVLMTRSEWGQSNQGASRLTFYRQPGGIYLGQIWVAGSNTHTELTSHPKADKEMAKASPEFATFEIATK